MNKSVKIKNILQFLLLTGVLWIAVAVVAVLVGEVTGFKPGPFIIGALSFYSAKYSWDKSFPKKDKITDKSMEISEIPDKTEKDIVSYGIKKNISLIWLLILIPLFIFLVILGVILIPAFS